MHVVPCWVIYQAPESKYLNSAYQQLASVSYIEASSPHCIGTGTLREIDVLTDNSHRI